MVKIMTITVKLTFKQKCIISAKVHYLSECELQ